MNRVRQISLFWLLFFISGVTVQATDFVGTWQNYWVQSPEVKQILMNEYKSIVKAQKMVGKFAGSRNTMIIPLEDEKMMILVSGLTPIVDRDFKKVKDDELYYDFSDIFLNPEKADNLKNMMLQQMNLIDELIKQLLKIQTQNQELLSTLLGCNLLEKDKNVLKKSFIPQGIKLSQLKRLVDAKQFIFNEIKESADVDAIHKLIDFIQLSIDNKLKSNQLIEEYLKGLSKYFSFIKEYNSDAEKGLLQLNTLKDMVSSFQGDLDIDLFDLISKEKLNDKILPFMHTETLFMYILEKKPLNLKPFIQNDLMVVLSVRDMCKVCENCMGKFFNQPKLKCLIGSLKENDESWNRSGNISSFLVKIPLDADNSDSMMKSIYEYRTTGVKVELDAPILYNDLLEKSLFVLHKTQSLERSLSQRMEALFSFKLLSNIISSYRSTLMTSLKDVVCRIIRNDKKDPLKEETSTNKWTIVLDPIWFSNVISEIDSVILQGIRAHQLVFTELYRNTRGEGIEMMYKACNFPRTTDDGPLVKFIEYLEQFRPKNNDTVLFSKIAPKEERE